LLLNNFWVIPISAVLYSGLMFVNYDMILGDAAQKFKITSSMLVKSMTWVTMVLGLSSMLTDTIYATLASEDYSNALVI